jgi:hypothetical protein
LAVYGADSVLTIVRRLVLGENIFEAHRKHAYQLMANELKFPHVLVSGFYMSIQLLIVAGFMLVPVAARWYYLAAVLLVLGAGYGACVKKVSGSGLAADALRGR